jgi:TRAP-type C4-dicarboxylate transport system substrate-binding protein
MKTTSISTRARAAVRAGASLLVAALAATLAGGAAAQDRAMTVKLATATLNDVQHEWMKRFAALLEISSGGRIKTELYPASQLGSIPRMIEATQLGSIQVWVGPPEFLVGVDQRFELLSVPGLFQNDQHALKTVADPEFSKAFLAVGAAKGLVGASLFFYGPGGYAMRTPVRSIADFRGKKIRVLASPFQTGQMARLGATGVPLSLGDVLPALQQGTIDGSFTTVPVFTTLQYQEAAKYITETGQAYVFGAAMLSKRWFDGLPADLQAQVMAAARQAETEVTPWELDFLVAQRKVWVDKGGELVPLTAADKAEIMTKLAPVGEDIVKTKPILKPLWDQMVATAKRHN